MAAALVMWRVIYTAVDKVIIYRKRGQMLYFSFCIIKGKDQMKYSAADMLL